MVMKAIMMIMIFPFVVVVVVGRTGLRFQTEERRRAIGLTCASGTQMTLSCPMKHQNKINAKHLLELVKNPRR